jgi:hypothetical protein
LYGVTEDPGSCTWRDPKISQLGCYFEDQKRCRGFPNEIRSWGWMQQKIVEGEVDFSTYGMNGAQGVLTGGPKCNYKGNVYHVLYVLLQIPAIPVSCWQ